MQWNDEGILLSARRHGESAAIISLLTRHHGRHAGLVRGAAGRRARPLYQPGNRLSVTWRGRLAEQLGQFTAEPLAVVVGPLLDDADRLGALAAACALCETTLPERDPHPGLHDGLVALIETLVGAGPWPEAYVRFELLLLAELGFGLDLRACAVTGATEGLAYVSPVSGRAVTVEGAGRYAPRLLPLPPFLAGTGAPDPAQIVAALQLTGGFLRRHLFDATDRRVPEARERLLARLTRRLKA